MKGDILHTFSSRMENIPQANPNHIVQLQQVLMSSTQMREENRKRLDYVTTQQL